MRSLPKRVATRISSYGYSNTQKIRVEGTPFEPFSAWDWDQSFLVTPECVLNLLRKSSPEWTDLRYAEFVGVQIDDREGAIRLFVRTKRVSEQDAADAEEVAD